MFEQSSRDDVRDDQVYSVNNNFGHKLDNDLTKLTMLNAFTDTVKKAAEQQVEEIKLKRQVTNNSILGEVVVFKRKRGSTIR